MSKQITVPMKECIIPMYGQVLLDVLNHRHTLYLFKGGRGSTKSSFVGGISIPLIIVNNPKVNAVCFRKVGNTVQNSVFAQVIWGIYQLGLEDLFKIPKSYATPIVYKPTGQCIYFMGLDDKGKVKSIKPKMGYIGVTWFEELDQFAGEAELRSVTQSTRRGGDKFWDFRSFNPPISANNWANEYADELDDDRALIISNTYKDVPVEWLGEAFVEDALELKAKNERAYQHEYLGIPVGVGGNVFENARDLDMTQLVTVSNTVDGEVKVPMYETFDKVYFGLDWGYSVDPFRLVKMHFDPKHLNLYIFDEFSTLKTRNEDVYHILFDELKIVTKDDLIIADSAEEKSIADFKSYGAYIRGARKGPDSVRYGIKWLQGLNNIYIDKRRCPHTYKEFIQYEYDTDKNGNFISAYPDKDNHSIDAVRYGLERYANRRGN